MIVKHGRWMSSMAGNEGLIIAEIELKSSDEKFNHPEWLDKEVSYDNRYFNSYLADKPYLTWSK